MEYFCFFDFDVGGWEVGDVCCVVWSGVGGGFGVECEFFVEDI